MMDYQEFKENIAEQVKEYLPKKYQDVTVEIGEVRKNNDLKLDGLMIHMPEENVTPTIYLNDYYEDYKAGSNMETILGQIAELRDVQSVEQNISTEDLLDFEKMKEKIIFRVVGAGANEKMLSHVPHRMEQDMAIVYQLMVGKAEEGLATTQITNLMMERFGVDETTLYEAAIENTPREFPAVFRPMNEVIKEILRSDFMGMDLNSISDDDDGKAFLEAIFEEGMKEMEEKQEGLPLFVLSNDSKINGASALFYPDIQDQIAEQMEGNYFVLPSSIHEVLVVPDNGEANYQELKDMVNEVNQTQVAPEEVLTGQVYAYDKESRQLCIAGEKKEKIQTAEKTGDKKASIMDTLKAKKDEVGENSVGKPRKAAEMTI